jgi:hypothetical protein
MVSGRRHLCGRSYVREVAADRHAKIHEMALTSRTPKASIVEALAKHGARGLDVLDRQFEGGQRSSESVQGEPERLAPGPMLAHPQAIELLAEQDLGHGRKFYRPDRT